MQPEAKHSTPRFFKIARLIGILGISLLMLNFFYQLWRVHQEHKVETTQTTICDIQQQDCTKKLPQDSLLTLSFSPRPITINQETTVKVSLTQMHPDKVALLVFPYPATEPAAQPMALKKDGEGIYSGAISLPKTNNAKQHWVAMVIISNQNQQIMAPFPFDTGTR